MLVIFSLVHYIFNKKVEITSIYLELYHTTLFKISIAN